MGNGTISGGGGNWNTTTTNWTNSSGMPNSTWQSGTAVFGAPGGSVTLTSAISAESLIFNTNLYLINGTDTLTLTGSARRLMSPTSGTRRRLARRSPAPRGWRLTGPGRSS